MIIRISGSSDEGYDDDDDDDDDDMVHKQVSLYHLGGTIGGITFHITIEELDLEDDDPAIITTTTTIIANDNERVAAMKELLLIPATRGSTSSNSTAATTTTNTTTILWPLPFIPQEGYDLAALPVNDRSDGCDGDLDNRRIVAYYYCSRSIIEGSTDHGTVEEVQEEDDPAIITTTTSTTGTGTDDVRVAAMEE